ncbi:MAG: outer membrane beta-barrel protein [Bacteroidales bacterium]|nr:outer membrane beta-barrel protein [Bacteroidales bacterium]
MHQIVSRFSILCLFVALPLMSGRAAEHVPADTLYSDPLREVTVTGHAKHNAERAASIHQSMDKEALATTQSLLVADAAKFFAGAVIRDYGGLGGMKTLSVRGMGAHHTAVSYDGITLSDGQTGQIDLGRYALDNLDLVALTIGEGQTLFQPARMNASAGLLALKSRRPRFNEGQRYKGAVSVKGGSFGLFNPDLLLQATLGRGVDISLNGHFLGSNGDYPFRLAYGDASDAYTVERRTNNQSEAYRLEGTVYADLPKNSLLEVKSYYYASSKGLPGAIILYNTQSTQHLWDKNGFIQARYEQVVSPTVRWQLNTKYGASWQRYLNPDYLGSTGKEDHRYRQDEGYLSVVGLYTWPDGWSVAWASDVAVNRMRANLHQFSNPYRLTWLNQASAAYVSERISGSASLLGTVVNEETLDQQPANDRWALNPGINVSYRPLLDWPLRLRAFYKSTYRMPSFNDLYYSSVGNRLLRPEQSRQLNLGMTIAMASPQQRTRLTATLDGYHNRITDKIMALPTKNIFVWSMVNLGKVSITGLDVTTAFGHRFNDDWALDGAWNHSYQRALDKTDPTSPTYDNQLAYAPRVYGSARVGLKSPWVALAWSTLWSGHRYVTGHNLVENDLPGFADQSLSLEKVFKHSLHDVTFRAEVLNLLGTSYEVIRNFPMPGRSYRLTVKLALR